MPRSATRSHACSGKRRRAPRPPEAAAVRDVAVAQIAGGSKSPAPVGVDGAVGAGEAQEYMGEPMVVMARVVGAFAVKGWIRVQPFTEQADSLLGYPVWWLGKQGGWTPRALEEGAVHGKSVVAKLAGCEVREAAAALQGLEVAVPRSELPERREGEYYWSDLLGIAVRNLQGELLGRVERLLETGANQVLVVSGDRERLIPVVAAFVVAVDLAKGEVVVDWGLDF